MHKKLMDMNPVDDFVTRNTPGLKIWDEQWGGMQCAYHVFAPGTDFTDILKGKGLEHDLCGVEHWAYVLKGTVEVIYLDGTIEVCSAGECVLLAGSAQLQVEGRGRDPPVQHRWRVGCARQENQGICHETDEEVSVDPAGPRRYAPRSSPFGCMTERGLPELAGSATAVRSRRFAMGLVRSCRSLMRRKFRLDRTKAASDCRAPRRTRRA